MPILYHYSEKPRETLLTRKLQNVISDAELADDLKASRFRSDLAPYHDHISFFFEPAPLDMLGEIFPSDHPTWREGAKIYEHVVKLEAIDVYAWRLVETPVSKFFMDYLFFKNDTYKRGYFAAKKYAQKAFGEMGTSADGLEKALRKYKPGDTRKAYEKLQKRGDFADMAYKYAPLVPHVMIYTKRPITVDKTTLRTVGRG